MSLSTAESSPTIATAADTKSDVKGGSAPSKVGGKVQLCRLSASVLIALWGKKFAEEERRKEAKLERETDMLEAQLNQHMRDVIPQIERNQTWSWVEQTCQRDAYIWVFPVPNNRASDVIDRCVDRVNSRNKNLDEESRWIARNSSDCDAHKKSITVCLAFGPLWTLSPPWIACGHI